MNLERRYELTPAEKVTKQYMDVEYELWLKRKALQVTQHWEAGHLQGLIEGFVCGVVFAAAVALAWLAAKGVL